MAKLRKQHADYTLLKNKHQLATNGDIYDSDYFTTIQGDGFLGDQMEIFSESNFKFSVSTRENSKKVRYSRKWDAAPCGSAGTMTSGDSKCYEWKLAYIKPSNTSESSIVLKSDYNSLQDFAYYGSALELVKSSMNDIIMNFPAGIFFSGDQQLFIPGDERPGGACAANIPNEIIDRSQRVYEDSTETDTTPAPLEPTTTTTTITPESESGTTFPKITFNGVLKINGCTGGCIYNSDLDTNGGVINFEKSNGVIDRRLTITGDVIKYPGYLIPSYDGDVLSFEITRENCEIVSTSLTLTLSYADSEVPSTCQFTLNLNGGFADNNQPVERSLKKGALRTDPTRVIVGYMPFVVVNPFNIDLLTSGLTEDSVDNPMRYLYLTQDDYLAYDAMGISSEITVTTRPYKIGCGLDSYIYGVFLGETSINVGSRNIVIYTYYNSGTYYYLTMSSVSGITEYISPNDEYIEKKFSEFDEFEGILLDRSSNPAYTAYFDTPYETEYGNEYSREAYTWPSIGDDNTGYYLPELNTAAYYNYVGKLVDLAIFYDNYWSDNIWRSMTHEAIRNLDWTFTKENGDDTETIHDIDSKKIEMMARLWGRNSDDVKRYIDNIKNSNRVTYDQKNNVPDYFLTDQVEIGGIDPVSLNLSSDNYARTDNLGYDAYGKSFGFTASDANNEVFRRLKINERYLTSVKGTVEGVKAMLAILGIPDSDYIITEYVAIAHNFPNADDVARLNLSRTSKLEKIASSELEGDYDGLPVVRVGVGDTAGTGDYVIPWYDKRETYDNGIYFQMYGGWGKRPQKKVYFDDEDTPRTIYSVEGKFGIYDETVQRLKFARDEEDMNMNIPVDTLRKGDICYVENVPESNFGDPELSGTTGTSEDIEIFAHYYKWDGSWMCVNMIDNNEIDKMKVMYVATLLDVKEGNNQHTGYGEYDDGIMYVDKLDNIFGEFCEDFMEAGEATWNEAMSGYTFEISEMEPDRQKCWYFKNEAEELESGPTLSASDNSEPTLCNFIDTGTTYGDNYINAFKVYCGSCTTTMDVGSDYIQPVNPESASGGTMCEEAASFSIVNLKNIMIEFKYPCGGPEDEDSGSSFYDEFEKYIDDVVMFYVKQMLPSTAILSYNFIANGIGGRDTNATSKMNNIITVTVT